MQSNGGTKLIWGDLAMCRFLSSLEMEDWDSRMTYAITLPISEIDRYARWYAGERSKRERRSDKRMNERSALEFSNCNNSRERYICIWLYGFLNNAFLCSALLHSTRYTVSVCECFFTLLLLLLLLFFCSLVGAGAYQCNCIECAYFYDHSLVSLNFRWH